MFDVKQGVDKILSGADLKETLTESKDYIVKLKVYPKGGWGSFVVNISIPDHWKTIDAFINDWVEAHLKGYERWEFLDKSIWK